MKEKTKKPAFRLTPNYKNYTFSVKDVVDIFLNHYSYWFTEKENMMYGKRQRIRRILTVYLTTGKDIARKKEEIYALNKLQSEWLEQDPVFGRID